MILYTFYFLAIIFLQGVLLTIGYVFHYALGDTIRILSSFYAIKHIYGCKLVIFGNALMRHLCNHTDFVDECVDIGELKACHIGAYQ